MVSTVLPLALLMACHQLMVTGAANTPAGNASPNATIVQIINLRSFMLFPSSLLKFRFNVLLQDPKNRDLQEMRNLTPGKNHSDDANDRINR
jgi:hypothetical protein